MIVDFAEGMSISNMDGATAFKLAAQSMTEEVNASLRSILDYLHTSHSSLVDGD